MPIIFDLFMVEILVRTAIHHVRSALAWVTFHLADFFLKSFAYFAK